MSNKKFNQKYWKIKKFSPIRINDMTSDDGLVFKHFIPFKNAQEHFKWTKEELGSLFEDNIKADTIVKHTGNS